jgi:DNA-binding XRE family transcriptional regulator
MIRREDLARLRPLERKALLEQIGAMVLRNEMTLGDAARFFRSSVLGMSRIDFARTVGVSHHAIAQLEDNADANPTLNTLVRVFAPFGAKIGLVFPSITDDAMTVEEEERRRDLLALLHRSRRPRRGKGTGKKAASAD